MTEIIASTEIDGVKFAQLRAFGDDRGRFMETFRKDWFPERSWEIVQTNRSDSKAGVLRGLVELGAIGFATTHDLALTALAGSLGGRARNMHFVDHFEDGVLRFDYTLRDGVVSTSNALALMRSVGLDV